MSFEKFKNQIHLIWRSVLGQAIINESFGSTDEINLRIEGTPGMYILEIKTDERKFAKVNVIKE